MELRRLTEMSGAPTPDSTDCSRVREAAKGGGTVRGVWTVVVHSALPAKVDLERVTHLEGHVAVAACAQHFGAVFVAVIRVVVQMARDAGALGAEEEAGLARAGDVEGGEAGAIVALDAGAHSVPAEVALELPPCLWDALDAVDGFHVDGVADAGFGHPHGAEEMGPLARGCLLEGAALVRAEEAGHGAVGGDGALATEPLALGDVWDAVAVLVDGEVAAVAEYDCVRVFGFAIVADGALAVFASLGVCVVVVCACCSVGGCGAWTYFGRDACHEVEPLLLELVEDDLESLVGDGVEAVLAALLVECIEPLLVLLVHVVLDLPLEVAFDRLDIANVVVRA
ncbi:hypothetical protein L1887_47800 [Cichorium endivia]|nr:hypothetical protein L1887_47800 [Cichorium endivia]